MEIPIDVEVLCSDGPGGQSIAVVLNPETKQVTHFAVRTKGFLADEYLVPVELIAESTPAGSRSRAVVQNWPSANLSKRQLLSGWTAPNWAAATWIMRWP